MTAVNENRFRTHALNHFLTFGLGSVLTRQALENRISVEDTSEQAQLIAILRAGSILERICWVGLGERLGYFAHGARPLSDAERIFLLQWSAILTRYDWPSNFIHILKYLLENDPITASVSEISAPVRWAENERAAMQSWSAFQASHIISECLNEGPIRSFFAFLLGGDFEKFHRETPETAAVFDSLRQDRFVPKRRASVLAGFIRYTEYLSAMDSLFSSSDLFPSANPSGGLEPSLASQVREIIRWRVPGTLRAQKAYYTVQFAFGRLVSRESAGHPGLGLECQVREVHRDLIWLSSKIFGFPAPTGERLRKLLDSLENPETVISGTGETGSPPPAHAGGTRTGEPLQDGNATKPGDFDGDRQ